MMPKPRELVFSPRSTLGSNDSASSSACLGSECGRAVSQLSRGLSFLGIKVTLAPPPPPRRWGWRPQSGSCRSKKPHSGRAAPSRHFDRRTNLNPRLPPAAQCLVSGAQCKRHDGDGGTACPHSNTLRIPIRGQ